jgi:hypothetical protein
VHGDDARRPRTIRPPFIQEIPDLAPAPALGEHTEEILAR